MARIYNNIGNIFMECHNYDRGLLYLLKSEDFSKRYSDKFVLSVLYNNLSEIYIEKKDMEKVKHYLDLSENHLTCYQSDIGMVDHLTSKWRYAIQVKDQALIQLVSQQAIQLMERIPRGNNYVVSAMKIFDALVEMGEGASAISWLEKGIAHLKSVEDYYNLKRYYNKLIQYYTDHNNEAMRLDVIMKSHQCDITLQELRLMHKNRSLEHIDDVHRLQEKERERNLSAYSALNDENTRLLAANNNLRAIHDIGVHIMSTTNRDKIYDILFEKVNQLFSIDEFGIGIINDAGDALTFEYSSELVVEGKRMQALPLDSKTSFSVQCYLKNEEIIVHDCEKERPDIYAMIKEQGDELKSLIYMPILDNEKPIGVMTVQNTQKMPLVPCI